MQVIDSVMLDSYYKNQRLINTGYQVWVDNLYKTMKHVEHKDYIMLLVEIYPPTEGRLARIYRKRSERLTRKNTVQKVGE